MAGFGWLDSVCRRKAVRATAAAAIDMTSFFYGILRNMWNEKIMLQLQEYIKERTSRLNILDL